MTVAELIDDNVDNTDNIVATIDSFPPDSRPHVRDGRSGRWVLLDTGACRSVWPHSHFRDAIADMTPRLRAANGTLIKTFGQRNITLRLGQTKLGAKVTLADVKRPIL